MLSNGFPKAYKIQVHTKLILGILEKNLILFQKEYIVVIIFSAQENLTRICSPMFNIFWPQGFWVFKIWFYPKFPQLFVIIKHPLILLLEKQYSSFECIYLVISKFERKLWFSLLSCYIQKLLWVPKLEITQPRRHYLIYHALFSFRWRQIKWN